MVKLKAWESMTNAERAEQTFRDIKLRQERRLEIRKRAEYEANSFTVESSLKAIARTRGAKNRRRRSCR